MTAFDSLIVGVGDMEQALGLWRDSFGMELRSERAGDDASTGALLGVDSSDIAHQVLLSGGHGNRGRLHLVEFRRPGRPVREDAKAFDLSPKNIDIYCRSLPERYEELQQRGFEFRSSWVDMEAGDLSGREAQLIAHDEINVGVIEIYKADSLRFDRTGFSGLGPVVITVADMDSERQFYRDHLGLEICFETTFAGPQIEKMVGLPAGAAIEMCILGDQDDLIGRLEIVSYRGAAGADLYHRARAPACGILAIVYPCSSAQAEAGHAGHSSVGCLDAIYGEAEYAVAKSPSGFRTITYTPD